MLRLGHVANINTFLRTRFDFTPGVDTCMWLVQTLLAVVASTTQCSLNYARETMLLTPDSLHSLTPNISIAPLQVHYVTTIQRHSRLQH